MSRQEAVNTIVQVRGSEDYYSQLISAEATKLEATDKAIIQLMFDIILGIASNK